MSDQKCELNGAALAAEKLVSVRAVGPSRAGVFNAAEGLVVEMPTNNAEACAAVEANAREKIREALGLAASNERRRLAECLEDARRLLALHAAERRKDDALAKPTAFVVRTLTEALEDPNAYATLPPTRVWYEKRMRLESLLTLARDLIREHMPAGTPGVPGARVAEVLVAIDTELSAEESSPDKPTRQGSHRS